MTISDVNSIEAIQTWLPFRLHDFTRYAWVSDAARDAWEPRIRRVSAMLAELEWRTIERGFRAASLQVVAEANSDYAARLRIHGFELVRLQAIKQAHTYSASLTACTSGARDAHWCAIGRKSAVTNLVGAVSVSDNNKIGRLLGYPQCCIECFKGTWVDESLLDNTWAMSVGSKSKTIRSTHEIDILTISECATHLRWLGARAVFHLPCSYDCDASKKLARRHLLLAREVGFAEEAAWLSEMLCWPVEWSALHGIAEIRTPVVKIVTHTDATPMKYLMRYVGDRKAMPNEALPAIRFPFSPPALPILTGSRSFTLGLENLISPTNRSNCFEVTVKQIGLA